MKRELGPVAVNLDARLDLYEIIAAEFFGDRFKLIPHTGLDGAAAVAKLQAKILLAFARVANFFFANEKESSDGLFGAEIGDERRLHQAPVSAARLPKSKNFLWPFLVLVTSGVALTS